jgi:hypothetical protein
MVNVFCVWLCRIVKFKNETDPRHALVFVMLVIGLVGTSPGTARAFKTASRDTLSLTRYFRAGGCAVLNTAGLVEI